MTPSWNSTRMHPMVWSWKATSSRGPATLSRPGTGEMTLATIPQYRETCSSKHRQRQYCQHPQSFDKTVCILLRKGKMQACDGFVSVSYRIMLWFCRRWFSIQNSQLVYQKKFKVQLQSIIWCSLFHHWSIRLQIFFSNQQLSLRNSSKDSSEKIFFKIK